VRKRKETEEERSKTERIRKVEVEENVRDDSYL